MIEILSALVANGTTVFNLGYAPWIPFYNFIPISILAAGIFYLITKSGLLSVMFFVSEFTSVIPTYLIWYGWGLDPWGVFGVWFLNTVIIGIGQLWLLDRLARMGEEEKENGN